MGIPWRPTALVVQYRRRSGSLGAVAYSGSRTTSTDVWLWSDDYAALDAAVRAVAPVGAWQCSHPGPRELHQHHLHRTLPEALACGGVQAFLVLPFGTRPNGDVQVLPSTPKPEGLGLAGIQLLRTAKLTDDRGEHLRAGSLAVRWFQDQVGDAAHELLTTQTKTVWTAFRRATRPAKLRGADGRSVSGKRIGHSARLLVEETGLPLSLETWARYSLDE